MNIVKMARNGQNKQARPFNLEEMDVVSRSKVDVGLPKIRPIPKMKP